MLWCAVCCEPYHLFCLQAEDLPPTRKNGLNKYDDDWICRRCAVCKICGQPGDITNNSNESESSTINSTLLKQSGISCVKSQSLTHERKRLKCFQCTSVFHSDCLQPSQQKIIKVQGDNWVSIASKFCGSVLDVPRLAVDRDFLSLFSALWPLSEM